MEKFISILLLGSVILTNLEGKNRSTEQMSIENYKRISLSDFSQLVFTNVPIKDLKEYLIECPAGSELPLKFILRGDLFSFGHGTDLPITVKLLKTCYLKHESKRGLVFSTDLQTWKQFEDFIIGKAAVSVCDENQFPTACFELELNTQQNRLEIPFGSTPFTRNRYYYRFEHNCTPSPESLEAPTESQGSMTTSFDWR